MKYCRSCGKELADEAVICTGCGCATDEYYTQQQPSNSTPKSGELSTMALLGFIFSFISCLVGLILSCIAYKTAVNENDAKSKSFSKAGIIISSVFLGSGLIAGVVYGIVLAITLGSIGLGGAVGMM